MAVITDFGSARALSGENPAQGTRTGDLSAKQHTRKQPGLALDKALEIRVEPDCLTLTDQRGTIRWAAPEILEEDQVPDLSTDVWAFGWICWEAITGNFPFDEHGESSNNEVQIIMRIVDGELPALKDNIDLKQIKALCSYMETCWNRNPADRPSAVRGQQILEYIIVGIESVENARRRHQQHVT